MYDISISCENIFSVVFRLGNFQHTRWTARNVCRRYRSIAAFALDVFWHDVMPPLCTISTVTRRILMTVLEVNARGFWMNIILVQKKGIIFKHFFIIPTDTHSYKIIGMLKTIKIPTVASTCFGSRRNHPQGAISCLAKTTIMILLCSSLMTLSVLWRHTSLLCKRAVHGRGRNGARCKHEEGIIFVSKCEQCSTMKQTSVKYLT